MESYLHDLQVYPKSNHFSHCQSHSMAAVQTTITSHSYNCNSLGFHTYPAVSFMSHRAARVSQSKHGHTSPDVKHSRGFPVHLEQALHQGLHAPA